MVNIPSEVGMTCFKHLKWSQVMQDLSMESLFFVHNWVPMSHHIKSLCISIDHGHWFQGDLHTYTGWLFFLKIHRLQRFSMFRHVFPVNIYSSTWEDDSHSVCNMTLFCLQTLDNFCLITNLLNFEKTFVHNAFASSRRITLNRRTTGRIPNAWEFLKVLTPFKITPKTQGTPSWMGVNLTQLFFQCSNVCGNSRLRICLSIGHSNPTSFKSVAGWSGVGISDGTIHGIWLLLVSI